MEKINQSRKYSLGLAGEFLVAGELMRRNIHAAITYGNSKKADIMVFNDSVALSIEVKTTNQSKWVIGNKLPEISNQRIWVLVHLPADETGSPKYYVFHSKELHELLAPKDIKYRNDYRKKHGIDFERAGVVSITINEIEQKKDLEFLSAWHKVQDALTKN